MAGLLIFVPNMEPKTALIAGATGLVGEECLHQLLASENYFKVIAITRKPLKVDHPKFQNVVVNFDNLEKSRDLLVADDIYCAMGTTIRKAGSQEAFLKVDVQYPEAVARLCVANGAKKFMLVSAIGADSKSAVFYNRAKGALEDAISKMGFESAGFFRPSILLGNRKEKRTGEAIGRFIAEKLDFLFAGPLKKYRGTPADVLAAAMIRWAARDCKGVEIIENDEILA